MTAAHTPGPWGLDFGATRFDVFCEENGFHVAQVAKPSTQARGKEYREDLEVCTANAKLVTAAPDLLAAAQLGLAFALLKWGNLDKDANAAFDVIRAAIAKASATPYRPTPKESR